MALSRLNRLIGEVHRRSLWQVLAVYAVAAWIVLQVVQTLTESLGLPLWFPQFAVLLLLIGLPIVLATAFVQQGAPGLGGGDPTLFPSVGPGEGQGGGDAAARSRPGGAGGAGGAGGFFTWRNAISGGVLALALWGAVAAGWLLMGGKPKGESGDSPFVASVAVLPFTNMSADAENEYFSDGITDDIITQLSRIANLKVISRTSVMGYKGTDKNMRQIGDELDVATILEGGVRRQGDRVRINAQLIDAQNDAHLWAQTYDRQLEDIFAIQSDVAQQIALALEATLTPEARRGIEATPTSDVEAYDFYLRGLEYLSRGWEKEDLEIAIQMYERAIELDPAFALAYAKQATAHAWMYWFDHDLSQERVARAKAAADRALRLAPDLPEAHAALGWYYYHCRLDYENALRQFGIAQESAPGNTDVLLAIGAVQRRQGKFERSVRNLARAAELDPRSAILANEVAFTYLVLRQYDEAERYVDRAISVQPDWWVPYFSKVTLYLQRQGEIEKAKAVLERASGNVDPSLLLSRLAADRTVFAVLGPEYREEFNRLDLAAPGTDTASYYLAKAQMSGGGTDVGRAYYDSARAFLEGRVKRHPDDPDSRSRLGIAYAGLGRKQEAVREGVKGVELHPISQDALDGPYYVVTLAEIYVLLGEHDAAIDQLEQLADVPMSYTANWLRLAHTLEPLRDHPRFQELLASVN